MKGRIKYVSVLIMLIAFTTASAAAEPPKLISCDIYPSTSVEQGTNVSIDCLFSESVDYEIRIETATGDLVKVIDSGTAKNPEKAWWNTTTGTSVGTYNVNVTMDNSTSELSSHNSTNTIKVTAAGDTTAPTVTGHTPTDGETDVSISTDITVTFSDAMNQTSAQDAFSIDPDVDGLFDWDDDTMTFTPDDDLEYNTTYEVTIKTEAESSGGANLAEESKWKFTTESLGHSTGFRIWDAGREPPMDLNYTWDARSFTGFYYDLDDDISTETLNIHLGGYDDRTIDEDNLTYTTTAADIDFEHDGWDTYKVIGFMAEKYFAGYEEGKAKIADEDISLISKDMLSKVLIDEDEKHMISTGASLQLEEDYELRVVQLDVDGNQAQVELLKNGKSVDTDIVTSPADYIYEKDLGKLDDVPLVAVHITSVFAGTESDMLVIEGI
ncbi:hypothetical protein CW696_09545, partial [ANME-2 cluster archaeon]